MKINLNNEKNKVPFSDIGVGDVFKFCGGYFIRIESIYNDSNCIANAIELSKGDYCFFNFDKDYSDTVTPINAELYVNE